MRTSTKHYSYGIALSAIGFRQKQKIFLLVFFLFSFFNHAFSQENAKITVSGTVKDSIGAPVSQVSIQEKGTKNAVMTGGEGTFSITVVNENSVLVISSVGYSSQEVRVGNQKSISILLLQASTGLQEVVVVGYGTQK